ncbi:hypothetical protein ACLMJK_001054 [Lecanora helva]
MDRLAEFLQAVGYHSVQVWPLLPMNLHLILSALFPIYTGAHASLSRPPSAAKPKRQKHDDNGLEENEHRMEGMSSSDAILLPMFAGTTLVSFYFIIKWLEDPAILNKILNWYFSAFGVLSFAKLMTDAMAIITSLIFPAIYCSEKQIWTIDIKHKKAISASSPPETRDSPLPGLLARLPVPKGTTDRLWWTRDLSNQKYHIRIQVRHFLKANFKVGPQGGISFLIAVAAQIYYNLIDRPWWMTNAFGFSLAYNALQIISPTNSRTGSSILGALFAYDIYFVFFTPMMVTVATKLDIPAKLLFPRPNGPGDDPTKQGMSLLGLGDIVVPGMMIGFALRFDLYLFYLRKMTRQEPKSPVTNDENAANNYSSTKQRKYSAMEKHTWSPARGGWGERFWSSRQAIVASKQFHGTNFPKVYFHATLIGYVVGMSSTLGVMQIFGHAQPALLYLVPCVLTALWGTAIVKGDFKLLWEFSEADEEGEDLSTKKENKKQPGDTNSRWTWGGWKSIFSPSKAAEQLKRQVEEAASEQVHGEEAKTSELNVQESSESKSKDSPTGKDKAKDISSTNEQKELVSFSICLPDDNQWSS